VEARDPKPDRPRTPDAGAAGRQISAVRGSVVQVRGGSAPIVPVRTGPRSATSYPVSRRIATRPMPHTLPIITHAETGRPGRYASMPGVRSGFGLPNLRRNVCPHFYMTGSRGAIPIQAPHLLKALIRQEQNVSRCQLRGGVHLEQGYVNDVCLTPRFNQCVFYEDELTKD
jgi:hypothetical protein